MVPKESRNRVTAAAKGLMAAWIVVVLMASFGALAVGQQAPPEREQPRPYDPEAPQSKPDRKPAKATKSAQAASGQKRSGGEQRDARSEQERNKELVRRFYDEVWQQGNLDFADQVFAADYVRHDPRGGSPPAGPQGQKLIAAGFRRSFPDLNYTIEQLLADGDLVAARWTIRATNTGPWAGQPATGRKVEFTGVNTYRFRDGKVVEIWNNRDDLGFRQQIEGTVPAGGTGGMAQGVTQQTGNQPGSAPPGALNSVDQRLVAEEIRRLNKAWGDAYVKSPRDIAGLRRILADDYAYIDWQGQVVTKATEIAGAESPALKLDSIDTSTETVRVFGNTAVTTGRYVIKGTFNGKDAGGSYRFTAVYVNRDGRWQVAASQETKMVGP